MARYPGLTGFMANVNRGLGFGDPLIAAVRTAGNIFASGADPRSIGDQYAANLAAQRRIGDSYATSAPAGANLARGIGMAAVAPTGETAALATRLPSTAEGIRALFAASEPATNLFAWSGAALPEWQVQTSDGHMVTVRAPDRESAQRYASAHVARDLWSLGGHGGSNP